MKNPAVIYLDRWYTPVDLESLDSCAGVIRFTSIKDAFKFISHHVIYKREVDSFYTVNVTYDKVQKYLKRYGYFKGYTTVQNVFVSFMLKNN